MTINNYARMPVNNLAVVDSGKKDSANLGSIFGSTNKISSNSDFVSSIVHELKTPLNAIVGFSEILEDEVTNPKFAAECAYYAKEISLASQELLEIVHDLLDVGVANSGIFAVDLEQKIDVVDAIRRAIRLNWDYSLRRNISLKLIVQGVEVPFKSLNHQGTKEGVLNQISAINLDAKRMKQILTNLISNAVKYSPAQTEVKISIKEKSELSVLEIIVEDQGFGMTQDQLSQIFTPYKTFQNPNSNKVDSTGLGLPITKQLIELQNGKIFVKSELNKGTEVTLNFPYVI